MSGPEASKALRERILESIASGPSVSLEDLRALGEDMPGFLGDVAAYLDMTPAALIQAASARSIASVDILRIAAEWAP